MGWPSAAYWSSLTIIDPRAALLLVIRLGVGIPATVAVIATNVVDNLAITALHAPSDALMGYVVFSPQRMGQISFLRFVVAT